MNLPGFMKHGILPVLGITFFLLCPPTAYANPEEDGLGTMSLTYSFVAQANLEDMKGRTTKGETSIHTAALELDIWLFDLEYQHYTYEFNHPDALPFGNGNTEPWQDVHQISLGFGHMDMTTRRWGYFYNLGMTTGFEKEISDSFGVNAMGGLIYASRTTDFLFQMGALVSADSVETMVIPVLGANWNTHAPRGPFFSFGMPQTLVGYRFSPEHEISAGATYQSSIFRLSDTSPVSPKGYMENKGGRGFLAYSFSPAKRLSAAATLDYHFEREITLFDDEGENERSYEPDSSLGISLIFDLFF